MVETGDKEEGIGEGPRDESSADKLRFRVGAGIELDVAIVFECVIVIEAVVFASTRADERRGAISISG